jgi:hypothetical protein
MPLSPREQRILAEIEDELGAPDPALAAPSRRSPVLAWLPLSAIHAGVLVLALLTLVVLHSLGIEPGAVGTAILTIGLIAPWVVVTARASQRRPSDVPGAPRPGATDHDVLA